jgi:hypothetical protein
MNVLAEVVREGEVRLAAQFEAANSADQRAVAWFGFLVTLVLGSLGGAATLFATGQYIAVAYEMFIFSAALIVAAVRAIQCIRPAGFAFPGNLPENWLPECWDQDSPRDLRQARIEQARSLNNCIDDNRRWAEANGRRLRSSIDITIFSLAAIVLAVAMTLPAA